MWLVVLLTARRKKMLYEKKELLNLIKDYGDMVDYINQQKSDIAVGMLCETKDKLFDKIETLINQLLNEGAK
jgi:hypothetical protein